ncbi:hypothetical protein ACGFYA_13480 [Streptomyces sp. NPDC048305]|uniref:hypothetical protein n=1 Tax=Streptomyces sp. NPDC048305 TaxID=3365532 RepID=UPI0037226AB3
MAIAPLVTDTVGEAVNTFIGHEIDKAVDRAEEDPTEKAQTTSSEFYRKGTAQLGDSFQTYLDHNPKQADEINRAQWKQQIESAYLGTGTIQGDYRGRPAFKADD